MKTWIRLSGLVGLVFIVFGVISLFYVFDDDLFRRMAYTQMIFGVLLCGVFVTTSFGETMGALLRNKEKLFGALGGLLTLLILIGVNVMAHSHWGEMKIDVTKNKIHSLDSATGEILKTLETDVQVTSFIVDPRLRPLFENLAARYHYQNAKFTYRTLDGKKDPKILKELAAREGQIVFENKKTKKTVLLESGQINEQDFSSALRRVLGEIGKKIYYVALSDESLLENRTEAGLAFQKILLEREGYQVEALNLFEKAEIPSDASMIVLWGGQKPTPESVVQSLIQYAQAGGKLLIAQDPILSATRDSLIADNLNPLAELFGLKLSKSIIVQLRPAMAIKRKGNQAELVRTGTQRLVRVAGLGDSGHPIVESLKNEIFDFVFAQALEELTKKSEKLSIQTITQTAPAAVLESSIKTLLNADEVTKEEVPGNGPHAIAKSASLPLEKPGPFGTEAKLILFGNAEFGRNTAIQQGANADLLMNSFNFLVDAQKGLMIRPKSWTPSTLKISEQTRTGVYFASIFLLPMLIIIFGLSVWNFRRSRI